MSNQMLGRQIYTIMEVAKLSGLPESTLRYYERIGLIHPIRRGVTSKQREYSEQDLDKIIALACLSATGMSIEDMRTYLGNRSHGSRSAAEQASLLETQRERIKEGLHEMQLRQRYVDAKIACWRAIETGDEKEIAATTKLALGIASELRLPKERENP